MNIGQSIVGRFEPLGAYAQALGKNFAPKVSISVAADPTWNLGDDRLPSGMKGGLTAVIDTGSDVTRIDTALVEMFHLRAIGEISSSFTGINSQTSIYIAQMVFPQEMLVIGGPVTAVNLRATGNYHDVILGLDVLSGFELMVSEKLNVVSLTWLGM